MNNDTLTYNDCAPLLRDLGYAPCNLRDGAEVPLGPWRIVQLDHAGHARPDDGVGVLCALPAPRAPAAHAITDHVSTWLAAITVQSQHADVLAIVERASKGGPVRVAADGSRTYVFQTSERIAIRVAYVTIDQTCIPLDGEWPNGDLLATPRVKLPELTLADARDVADRAEALASDARPAFVQYAPPKVVPAVERTIRMERGNTDEVLEALRENGYAPIGVPWGDEPSGRAYRRGAAELLPPAVAVFLRAPTTPGFTYAVAADDHRHTWLVLVTVKAAPKLAADVERVLSSFLASGKRVSRADPDTGATLYLFKHDCGPAEQPFRAIPFNRARVYGNQMAAPGTHVSVTIQSKECAPLVLGPGVAWDALLKVRRDELPEFDRGHAESLVAQLHELLEVPQPAAAGIVERAKRAIRGGR
jgi:hypothetical protein